LNHYRLFLTASVIYIGYVPLRGMKPTENIITLELDAIAGLSRMRTTIEQISQAQPDMVLVKFRQGHIDEQALAYRDHLIASREEFINATFKMRPYRNKARKMIEDYTKSINEDSWWKDSVLLVTKLLHLALTEAGNQTLWIDAQKFDSFECRACKIQELKQKSHDRIVISQDILAA